MYLSYEPILFFREPTLLEDLYVTQNKYFDKSFVTRGVFHKLTGDSILFEDSSEFWNNKRKKMSIAFYKDKLIKMVDIVKKCMQEKVEEFNTKFIKNKEQMNLIAEISNI